MTDRNKRKIGFNKSKIIYILVSLIFHKLRNLQLCVEENTGTRQELLPYILHKNKNCVENKYVK